MKRRIATDLLKLHQLRKINSPHPFTTYLNTLSYELTSDIILDIKRPFKNICIHGREPHLFLPFIQQHNQKFSIDPRQFNITLVDCVRCENSEQLIEKQIPVKEMRYVSSGDSWVPEQNCYDLVISSLKTHQANDQQDLFRKYLRSLEPDGALVGTSFVQGTLKQLYWTYLLAQNQRYGGMSPKVLTFPSLGQTGTHLTNSNYQLITILQQEEILELQSFIDILTILQQMGQSGYLRGRRKGIYKDLLLAAGALYHGEWAKEGTQNNHVHASFCMSKFIGWKYHQSQPKKLKPGPQVGSIQFSEQLRKFGDEVEDYQISEDSEQPRRIK